MPKQEQKNNYQEFLKNSMTKFFQNKVFLFAAAIILISGFFMANLVFAAAPQLYITPSSGQKGTKFIYTGNGFTPNGSIKEIITKPDGTQYFPLYYVAGSDGVYVKWYDSNTASIFGTYTIYWIDQSTGRQSNSAYQTIIAVSAPTAPAPAPTTFSKPTASIIANPLNAPYNSSVFVSWVSTNASSCTVSPNGWIGTNGYQNETLTAAKTYTLNCSGQGGSASASVSVTVLPQQNPIPPQATLPGAFTLTAQNPVCDSNLPVSPAIRLNWTVAAGATSNYTVYRNGSIYNNVLVTDLTFYNSTNVIAGQSYSYYVQAKNVAGYINSNTVAVAIPANICSTSILPSPPNAPAPQTLYVSLSASQPSITAGQNASLTADVSGTAQGTIHYQFDCTNNGSYEADVTNNTDPYTTSLCNYPSPGTYTAKVHVERGTAAPVEATTNIIVTAQTSTYLKPTAKITADPLSVPYNSPVTISWTSTDATSCTVSPTGWTGTLGSKTETLIVSKTYTLNCSGQGGEASNSIAVIVEQQQGGIFEPFEPLIAPFYPKKLPDPPVINNELQPNSGAPGIKVKIKGKNFKPDQSSVLISTKVFFTNGFNHIPADIVSDFSDTEIVAIVPIGKDKAEVTVENAGGTSNIVFFTYKPPEIYNISPPAGETGVPVVITGENFGDKLNFGQQSVMFGETSVISDSAISWKDNEIVVLAPSDYGMGTTKQILVGVGGCITVNKIGPLLENPVSEWLLGKAIGEIFGSCSDIIEGIYNKFKLKIEPGFTERTINVAIKTTSGNSNTDKTFTYKVPTQNFFKEIFKQNGKVLGEKIVNREYQLEVINTDAAHITAAPAVEVASAVNEKRDLNRESQTYSKYVSALTGVENIKIVDTAKFTNFISYGTETTKSLGAGERAGVINSFQSAFGKLPESMEEWQDVIKIANGRWPTQRDETKEKQAEQSFKIIYQRAPNRDNPNDNA
ncbi:MAG: hypothetical protein ABIB72_00945, partial [Candidatus Falkowbacteria bacterium]